MLESILTVLLSLGAAGAFLGDAYQVACEDVWGGTWVNDNPSFVQSYSCVGGTRPDS